MGKKKLGARGAACVCSLVSVGAAFGETPQQLDEVSVTATREARSTGNVPQAISVVGKETLADKKMFNVKEALQEVPGVLIDSKNGGFDARLIIRGAGLKAAYGVREIMVLRDGVPLSDPDSFTRLDFVDTQDIERIEVAKGPGNLFAAGSAGGAIQIISKSVFDNKANNLRIGYGNQGTQNQHFRYGGMIGDNQALALTVTHREMDNDWRTWNRFDTTQSSIKHGLMLGDGDVVESEISYAESNMQLPGSVDGTLYERFKATGRQDSTTDAWKNSGRYSKVWFFNSRLEAQRGDFIFKPRIYYNTWYHYHPVTGIINETESWVSNLGMDLEANYKHAQGTLVAGVTARQESSPDSRKYQYGDVRTSGTGRVLATLSDRKGALAEIDDSKTLLTGAYLQESWRPTDRWIVDAGMRYDVVTFDDDNQQFSKYDYSTGKYVTSVAHSTTSKTFHLPAPKLAASYAITPGLNLFAMVAQAGQIPSSSEFANNHSLEAPISRNFEVGLKGRATDWTFDTSVYYNPVSKDIVQQRSDGVTNYVNAGKTDKKGFEFAARYVLDKHWEGGGYYSFTNYRYKEFTEVVGSTNFDRSGNTLPFVPHNQYGVFVGWKQGGWRARVSSNTWGEYWIDSANTRKYQGWEWVTNASLAYQWREHSLTLSVDNVFDQHYAAEVTKDTMGNVRYTLAAPRTTLVTYRYDFR